MPSRMEAIKEGLNSSFVYDALRFLLAVLLFWQLGALVGSLLQRPEAPILPKVSMEQLKGNQPHSIVGARLFLFGQPEQKTVPVPQVEPTAQKTQLNLKLIGLVDLGDRGVALIEKAGQTLVLSPGDWVEPGVKLLKLLPNQVILLHNGQQERLILQGAEEEAMNKSEAASVRAANSVALDTHRLNFIAQQLRRNPMAISRFVRFKPVRQNGQWLGVQVWPKSETALFRALGFRSGDIIRRVDGRTIQQFSEQPHLWQQYRQKSQFELEVERQGEFKTIMIDLNHPG